ncbi:vitamin K epoxide reductase family protein [Streptomyces beihaiensis]|uniref:Vitamin K epoxide reductase family protein n=1 Tax=Streptomyces beihaiensis TaxID=2984495 RepID=A0ABT3TMX8_9ACTN|nr:vitamin K epoxide reductase family protein [Streptomyces beihaiensis]MCX3058404.1 vitamin K epoxide reductase family protein [Streptomyces beihaiensis]
MTGGVRGGARGGGRGGARIGWLLVVTGALGLLSSFVITIDKIRLAENPDFVPSCSISPVLSCTDVMRSAQASVFGFPNPVIGLVTYAAVAAVGLGVLAGARYRRWFWLGLNLGTLAGAGFCMWLMTQALYEIGALCLWCALAWAATVVLFSYVTTHNVRHGVIRAPRGVVAAAWEFAWVVPVVWCGMIALLILTRFWSYWQTLP